MPRVQTRLSQRTANKRRAKSRNVPGTEVSKKLTHGDIQDFLVGCAAAIELDQIRVDALPIENFHPLYEDGMWRRHRNLYLVFINQLLATVNEIPQRRSGRFRPIRLPATAAHGAKRTCRPDCAMSASEGKAENIYSR